MVQYIITPWRSQRELLHIRQQLYPESEGKPLDAEDRKQAVAQVSVWMQRGNCPHLVESSAILTSAMLNDVPGNSTYCVRAAYSAAFCRFVTGLLDSHQDKRHKLSMYTIAKTINLPATYVELRHQATHEELPSLSKLRTATQKALRWIWDYYWSQLPLPTSATSTTTAESSDCKAFVFKILHEEDGELRRRMESDLVGWKQDELLAALGEFQEGTEDVALILRATSLAQVVMGLGFREGGSDGESDAGEAVDVDLERVKNELSRMEGQMSDSDEEGEEVLPPVGKAQIPAVKGWTVWDAGTPWVSKPIGVV